MQKKYDAKLKRVADAVKLVEPDRIPIVPVFQAFPVYYAQSKGIDVTIQDLMYEYRKCSQVYDCLYDEEQKTLVSIDGAENIKTEITIDEEGSEIDWAEIYNDGKAVFSLNEDGKLIWKDEIKDEGAGLAFEKIGWFQGVWVAGEDLESRYELNCYWDVEEPTEGEVYSGYKVEIIRHENETSTFWSYACAYNAETDTLESALGVKEFSGEEGEPFTVVYEDGAAVFFFNDEGCIIWQDENENAGEGLQFNATNG